MKTFLCSLSSRANYCSRQSKFRLSTLLVSFVLFFTLSACRPLPQVRAEDRLFPDISLEFLGEYQLPKTSFQDTPVGGLSALTYDRATSRFYVLSDDRSQRAPARFYTLNIALQPNDAGKLHLETVEIESVTSLKTLQGEPFAPGSIDPEGIALSPRGSLFISSEGIPSQKINPFIGEFDLKSGKLLSPLRLPQRYLLNEPETPEEEVAPRGVQENLGFEALTLNAPSLAPEDPFRLFTAPESSLLQDRDPENSEQGAPIRLLHYLISPIGSPIIVSENLYSLEPAPNGTLSNGLTDLAAFDREGFLLSLERTYGLGGVGAKIFLVTGGDATDTTQIATLARDRARIKPLRKKLLVDLSELGINLDNLEGMGLGPHLPDGSQILVLVSDDNFSKDQVTQFLAFRVVRE
ncbi:esterase-like activity of phytase family protein [Lusitaniella coriacea LEGE 07157]|uniref:Esterase-like activity of phytase family protein n=1 Tax=Lusitaniella coriacea LEGE 07157 TaxID=945747 RepID=A0A8J7ITZ6_9CYAN|nr:esterase-like activity of phytase family protein [Lusitaniella coriacea]MBE9116173.1 esterase-like activity of phytase family protein [Lusitaniella coriacea LEGE 07157]